jgi:hypothetical protein
LIARLLRFRRKLVGLIGDLLLPGRVDSGRCRHCLVALRLLLVAGLGDESLRSQHGLGQSALPRAVGKDIDRRAGRSQPRAADRRTLAADLNVVAALLLHLLNGS